MSRQHNQEEVVVIAGAKASKCSDFTQIPYGALERLAQRFELGGQKHGRDNWRNGIENQDYVLARLSHIIKHCYLLSEKIQGRIEWDEDDDVGAIAWGAAFLGEALDAKPEWGPPK